MALNKKSLFLYNYTINAQNAAIDFVAVMSGPTLLATLRFGYYSLSDLLAEISRAMGAADPDNQYTATADRSVLGGLENRVSIATAGSFLSILWASGPRNGTNVASLIGFNAVDNTGATIYTGSVTSGTSLLPTLVGYNYLSPDFYQKVFGNVNVSASGKKESIVFTLQTFIQVQFKYEPANFWLSDWLSYMQWAILQRSFDFTPDISSPSTIFNCTLEQTSADGKGLAFKPMEMLPQFPNVYDVGSLKFRINTP